MVLALDNLTVMNSIHLSRCHACTHLDISKMEMKITTLLHQKRDVQRDLMLRHVLSARGADLEAL